MASYLPCVKNNAAGYIFYISLVSQASTLIFKASPTLAAGDVLIALDDGAPGNLGTLPVVDADFTKRVKVTLSQAETNADNLTIIFSDAAGAEWCDLTINIHTSAQSFDTTDAVVDEVLVDTAVIGALGAGLTALATQASVNTIDGIVDDILVDTAVIGALGAGLTALATQASVNTIDGIVDDILVDTAVIGALGAGLTALATQASVNTIDGIVDDILVDTAVIGALGAGLTALSTQASVDAIKTETALIVADTNELQTDWHDGGRLDLILDAAGAAGDPWITALPGAYGAGTAGKIIGDNINAPIATVDTVVDAIKADTGLIKLLI